MKRFMTAIILFASAAALYWYNGSSDDRVLSFMFLGDLIPSLEGDPKKLGDASALILVGMGGVSVLLNLFRRES